MAELAETVGAREPRLAAWVGWLTARDRTEETTATVVRRFLYVLLAVYVLKQALYVVLFPPFTGHDEVAHYAYLQTVATKHRVALLPTISLAADVYDSTCLGTNVPSKCGDKLPPSLYKYCNYVLHWEPCDPTNPGYLANPPYAADYGPASGGIHPVGLQYAANHPPLYYIMMTPLYWASEGTSPVTQQYLLRIAAIPFGILTVILAYLLATTLFPGDAFLAITVPAFVAFQTQVSYEAAMVNNDIVCIALYSWILYLLVSGLRDRFPWRTCILAGFAFGLALLSKGTSITAAGIIAFAMIFGLGWQNWRRWLPKGAATAALAGVI